MLAERHPEESVRAEVGHLAGIEALRAIAVTWVVLFHYAVLRPATDPWNAFVAAWPALDALVRNGYLGVDLFFLITGFLLVMPWARHAHQGRPAPDTRDFYVRRIRRIVPAYYVQLALLFAVFVPLLRGTGYVREEAGFLALNAAAHATFLHYMTPLTSASLSINGALWSLALEAQWYLLLPLVAPFFVRAPRRTGLALLAVAGGWRWLAQHDLDALVAVEMALGARWNVPESAIRHLLATQLPGYLGHFAVGMGLALAWLRRPQRASAWAPAACLAASVALLDWAYAHGGGAVLGVAGSWLATLAALALLLWALVQGGPIVGRLLHRRPLLFVGRVSYSIYLYHLPLLLVFSQWRPGGGPVAILGYLALVLAAAWASYTFVEARFLHRNREPRPV